MEIPEKKKRMVSVTFWIEKEFKDTINAAVERRGDLTRMIERGLRRELLELKKAKIEEEQIFGDREKAS